MHFSKRKEYERVIFPPEVFEEAISEFAKIVEASGENIGRTEVGYRIENEYTKIKSPAEYYRKVAFNSKKFDYLSFSDSTKITISFYRDKSDLAVTIDGLEDIVETDRIFRIFDKKYNLYIEPPEDTLKNVTVFIGHGRSHLWRDLKDHLHDKHGIDVVAYETGARAGLTIQEVLQEMASKASIAFLVLTAEDIDRDGLVHARENVVHETGLFQGVLGFKRAIVLLEEGCNEFSNIAGLQQLRFKAGSIKEIFGDVLAVVRREFTNGK